MKDKKVELPVGWEIKKLGELCKFDKIQNSHRDLPYVGLEHIESNTGVFLGNFEILKVKSSTFFFNNEHLLYGRLRPYLNKVLLPDFEGHCSTEIFPIKVNKQITRKFLFYWLISEKTVEIINATSTGARMPRANMNRFLEFKFAFPSLSEQKRIVSILDEIFLAIEKSRKNAEINLKNSQVLFESYLRGRFENKGEGWGKMPLISFCEEITDGSHFSPKSTLNDDYPYITVRDIKNDIIDFENCKFINEQDYNLLLKNGCKPNKGDILFSKDGTVGKVSLVDFEKTFVVLSSLAIIRPKKDIINSVFLMYILKNPSFIYKAVGMKTGAAIRRIILKNLKKIEISFPISLQEQESIVKQLDFLHLETKKLELLYQQKLNNLEELKKSILQKAFSGEL